MIIINLQKSDSQTTIKETCKQTTFSAYYLLYLNKIYQRHTPKKNVFVVQGLYMLRAILSVIAALGRIYACKSQRKKKKRIC